MEYKTVKKPAVAEFEDRRSRFIGNIIPVTDEKTATEFIEKVRRENFGARHNVYAYILRDGNIARYSDDGEPHQTAGVPTLDVLRKNGLCDCCIVTTRYFGGVLLGTGGLVKAYGDSVKLVLENIETEKLTEKISFSFSIPYELYENIKRILSASETEITDEKFDTTIKISGNIPKENFETLKNQIADLSNGKIKLNVLSEAHTH